MPDFNGYTAPLSETWLIKEIAHGAGGTGGTVTAPQNPVVGDTHIPFNPMTSVPYTIPVAMLHKALISGELIESTYEAGIVPGNFTFPAVYHSPFLMSQIFPKVTIGAWASDVDATLKFEMTKADYVGVDKSFCMHSHIDDKASSPNDIDLNLFGGCLESYKWAISKNDYLREDSRATFSQVKAGAIAFNSAPTFHGDYWAAWNDNWLNADNGKAKAVPYSSVETTTDPGAKTDLDDAIKVVNASFEILIPRSPKVYSGVAPSQAAHRQHLDVIGIIQADLIDTESIDEFLRSYDARERWTYKMRKYTGAFEEYLQATKMVIDPDGSIEIPPLNQQDNLVSAQLLFKPDDTAVITFDGKYDQSETPVPTNYV